MLLDGKVAVVYGAGSIGRSVAQAFAAEGAKVHLASRSLDAMEAAASEIRSAGGVAETAVLDALDEQQVGSHAAEVVAASGAIDISINLISVAEVFGTPLAEIGLGDFERPIVNSVRSNFLTARAAARPMIERRSGVIMTFGGEGDPLSDFYLGGFQVGLCAVEALRRQLAAELGGYGIRVIGLQSAGIAETLGDDTDREAITGAIVEGNMLKRAPTLTDVGNIAAFAASDRAAALTGTAINVTSGAEVD
jgi:NAD(P)-dependent dehydrogenase (short-subunit alcohol dehydrogenase family)